MSLTLSAQSFAINTRVSVQVIDFKQNSAHFLFEWLRYLDYLVFINTTKGESLDRAVNATGKC